MKVTHTWAILFAMLIAFWSYVFWLIWTNT
jgi:hypothetical protein